MSPAKAVVVGIDAEGDRRLSQRRNQKFTASPEASLATSA